MSNLIFNDVNIDKNDIDDVYLDLKRNITVTMKDSNKIVIKRTDKWKDIYKELTGDE